MTKSRKYDTISKRKPSERRPGLFTIQLAGLNIGLENRYGFVRRQCANYLTDAQPTFCVAAEESEIEAEIEGSTEEVKTTVKDLVGYSESIVLFRKICYELPRYSALLFHGAAVAYKGKAYIFSAPSGTGKTTHLRLWMRARAKDLTIINGDKPVFRLEDGTFRVYGTPWSGKEGWSNNTSAPLGGICFIRRSADNRIEELPLPEAASRAMKQILYPKDPQNLYSMLRLTDELIRARPVYLLSCNISEEAAALSFKTLTGEPIDGGTQTGSTGAN